MLTASSFMLRIPIPTHLKDLNPALARVAIQQLTTSTKIRSIATMMGGVLGAGWTIGTCYQLHARKEKRVVCEFLAPAVMSWVLTVFFGTLYLRQRNFQALYLPQLEQIVAKGG